MSHNLTKLVYKPDSKSTDEYMIIVNPDSYKKWKEGAFQVFHTQQGSQGILHHPSNQQLDNVFGTHKDVDVVKFLLDNAKELPGTFHEDKIATKNAVRGSMVIDTKGKAQTTGRG
ncbi:hypothetical protein CVT26_013933 [Gymnopilus dilepis]|uniref:Ribosome maturation protein SDO1/SBDS N-terminal domain-containing protein n=1 Tax=Gymnopilus dilepis TaxID=231916 RepID=A0A409VW13_9AGAR|nr:hypothetical protein CVT26_013933 [Gymnopilus dilepis]